MLRLCWLPMALLAVHGATLPPRSFTDTAGAAHSTAEWAAKRAVVIFFVTTDCPISNAYVPEMNRIAREYTARGAAVFAVQGDASIPDTDVRRHVKEFGYTFPYLFDPAESLAAYTGATTTPEAALLGPDGKVAYLGRIDNRVIDFGKQRPQATEFDLRGALDAMLAGKPVPRARTPVVGCAINRMK